MNNFLNLIWRLEPYRFSVSIYDLDLCNFLHLE